MPNKPQDSKTIARSTGSRTEGRLTCPRLAASADAKTAARRRSPSTCFAFRSGGLVVAQAPPAPPTSSRLTAESRRRRCGGDRVGYASAQ
ncbi:hypothetical protein GUJ93_ZPchr0014g47529 [Zizania palustris]|uniref:Uncharacterized protein n=1 Tax=Zizania palustris TaxID=103762 RepID=A0A8J5SXS8_ZIZPA|nr:hypothetical protein GUJ93_ZPchr0014g47529 [Zizania palustris]